MLRNYIHHCLTEHHCMILDMAMMMLKRLVTTFPESLVFLVSLTLAHVRGVIGASPSNKCTDRIRVWSLRESSKVDRFSSGDWPLLGGPHGFLQPFLVARVLRQLFCGATLQLCSERRTRVPNTNCHEKYQLCFRR